MSIQTIMTADETGEELVNFARQTAEGLINANLTRTQVRAIFTEVRQIQARWSLDPNAAIRQLTMLKPKLAYQSERIRPMAGLRDVLTEAITCVEKAPAGKDRDEKFTRFMQLFEAILAYHRAQGGRN